MRTLTSSKARIKGVFFLAQFVDHLVRYDATATGKGTETEERLLLGRRDGGGRIREAFSREIREHLAGGLFLTAGELFRRLEHVVVDVEGRPHASDATASDANASN